MIEITDAAKSEIKEILGKNPGKYLRLVVEGDGCAGPYLGISLDAPEADETTIEIDGLDLLVSAEARRYLDVARIIIFSNQVKELK